MTDEDDYAAMNPDIYLEASRRALEATHSNDAVALALQGILHLMIIQHHQAHEQIANADEDDEPAKGQDNPLGECASGHEKITEGCANCALDLAEFHADTIEEAKER